MEQRGSSRPSHPQRCYCVNPFRWPVILALTQDSPRGWGCQNAIFLRCSSTCGKRVKCPNLKQIVIVLTALNPPCAILGTSSPRISPNWSSTLLTLAPTLESYRNALDHRNIHLHSVPCSLSLSHRSSLRLGRPFLRRRVHPLGLDLSGHAHRDRIVSTPCASRNPPLVHRLGLVPGLALENRHQADLRALEDRRDHWLPPVVSW